jgi:hypothetical protein
VTVTQWGRGKSEKPFKPSFLLVSEKEVVCATSNGWLLFYDVETGELIREQRVNGDKIYAIGLHPDGDKIRVATDRELQVIGWK